MFKIKFVRLSVVILMLLSLITLSACVSPGPWDVDEVIWYSREPEIEITSDHKNNNYGDGYLKTDDGVIEIGMFWGWGREKEFDIITIVDSVAGDTLMSGTLEYNKDYDYVILKVEKDNVFNNKYKAIMLYRRPLK